MSQSAEYLALKAFLGAFTDQFVDSRSTPPAKRPLAVVEATERTQPERSASALRMAVNNCLELSGHWPYVQVAELDSQLRAKGILSLSQVRQRAWGRYAAITKHAQARSESEYQVVRAALADAALSSELPPAERAKLQAIQVAYEQKRPNPSLERTSTGKALRPRRSKA